MSDRLFQFAIILHPTEKEVEDEDKRSEVLVEIQTVLASSEQAAVIHASRQIPETHLDKLHRIEIAVRPF